MRTYVSVDGGMSDNPRPVLYGSGYEAFLPRAHRRRPAPKRVTIVGKHCESGDVLVREAQVPADLAVGDVLATPVTGAYGHSMGSNYNKVLRPAVVFVADGAAREVVRRETYEDLLRPDLALTRPATRWGSPSGAPLRWRRERRRSDGAVVRVGVLGCGNVGAPLVELIGAQGPTVAARTGLRLEVTRVAVRDLDQAPPDLAAAPSCSPPTPGSIVDDPDVDLIVELIGGVEPARELILAALKAGKPVVTGNKELLAKHGAELFQAAESAGVDLLFEAAVAGGIPIIRPLRESLVGERITRVMGIVNGTTNYILTRMTEAGASYADALAEAQSLGLRGGRPHRRRRGLRRRRQGRHHRQHRVRRRRHGRRRPPRGHHVDRRGRHRVRSEDGLRDQAPRRRRADRRGRDRRAGAPDDGPRRAPAGRGARELQRHLRGGRRGRRPHVLRARGRAGRPPPAPSSATSSMPPSTATRARTRRSAS